MKKFLIRIILFLVFTFCLYSLGIVLWTYNCKYDFFRGNVTKSGGYGFMYTRLKEVKNKTNVDVLFLGSSHAYRSFDTRFYSKCGLNVFNLGSSSQGPLQTQFILDKYLEGLNPKLIVFETYPEVFEYDGVESFSDIMSNNDVDFSDLKMCFKLNSIKCYNTFLNSLFSSILHLNDSFFEPKKIRDNTYVVDGFVEKEMAYNLDTSITFSSRFWSPNLNQIKAFESMISMFENRKIPLILIQVPYNSKLYNSYKDKFNFNAYFSSKGKYINYNDSLFFDNKNDFYDHDHLNKNGVSKLNKSILNIVFPTKRNE